jgi:hypothetical protein
MATSTVLHAKNNNYMKKVIIIAGVRISEETMPNIYKLAQNDSAGLEARLRSLDEASGPPSSLRMTAFNLENDLAHDAGITHRPETPDWVKRPGFVPIILLAVIALGAIGAGTYHFVRQNHDSEKKKQIAPQQEVYKPVNAQAEQADQANTENPTDDIEPLSQMDLARKVLGLPYGTQQISSDNKEVSAPSTNPTKTALALKPSATTDEVETKPVVESQPVQTPDNSTQILSLLKEDEQSLSALLDSLKNNKASWIDFSENADQTRYDSLVGLATMVSDQNLKAQILKDAGTYKEYQSEDADRYEELFQPTIDAVRERLNGTVTVEKQITTNGVSRDSADFFLGNIKLIDQYLDTAKKVNAAASDVETTKSGIYKDLLGYINKVLSVTAFASSAQQELANIEWEAAHATTAPKQIRCWEFTQDQDGVFSGKSTTTIRCE